MVRNGLVKHRYSCTGIGVEVFQKEAHPHVSGNRE